MNDMLDDALHAAHPKGGPSAMPTTNYVRLNLDQIHTNPQVRKQFDPKTLQTLAESLRTEGQLQPILVYQDGDRHIVLAGERRLRAAKIAGLTALDCIAFSHKPTSSQVAVVQITENTLREGLDPIELAEGYRELLNEEEGMSANVLADRLHVARSTITRALALLDLPLDLQAEIRTGELTPATARELARLTDDTQRRDVLARVKAGEFTHKQLSALVTKLLKAQGKKRKKPKSTATTYKIAGGFEAIVTRKRITVNVLPVKKERTVEDTIAALQALIEKLRETATTPAPSLV